ncbi:hypothetical protein OZH91_18885 [Escherichia coli]|nr:MULTISPECIES: hypothetical protein [Escherichia]MCM5410421.1 hypothetical protein [Escherichia coli]MCZ0366513.1 hypothetical protein [Escherichia coli]MCZ0421915.1 hypothetical protein [Escherichia coli]MCZ0458280.1 hypothetical protein [Escherichia coli]MCZ0468142.1 hypothetical protein [Escherichia coli]
MAFSYAANRLAEMQWRCL